MRFNCPSELFKIAPIFYISIIANILFPKNLLPSLMVTQRGFDFSDQYVIYGVKRWAIHYSIHSISRNASCLWEEFSRFKDFLQSCHAASAHQNLFFNCWLEWTQPQYFQAATASSEWSTFLADLSCRILISGSLSSNTHDFTETFNMFQLHKEGKIWEDKIKFIWQCV